MRSPSATVQERKPGVVVHEAKISSIKPQEHMHEVCCSCLHFDDKLNYLAAAAAFLLSWLSNIPFIIVENCL